MPGYAMPERPAPMTVLDLYYESAPWALPSEVTNAAGLNAETNPECFYKSVGSDVWRVPQPGLPRSSFPNMPDYCFPMQHAVHSIEELNVIAMEPLIDPVSVVQTGVPVPLSNAMSPPIVHQGQAEVINTPLVSIASNVQMKHWLMIGGAIFALFKLSQGKK